MPQGSQSPLDALFPIHQPRQKRSLDIRPMRRLIRPHALLTHQLDIEVLQHARYCVLHFCVCERQQGKLSQADARGETEEPLAASRNSTLVPSKRV